MYEAAVIIHLVHGNCVPSGVPCCQVCALPQIAYVHTGPMQVVFHSTHLTFGERFKVVLVAAFVFAFAEVEKAIVRRFSKSAACRASVGRSDRSIGKRGPHT